MKLVMAIVHDADLGAVIDALVEADLRTTQLPAAGGFLRRGSTTLMLGVEDAQVAAVCDLLRATAHGRTAHQRGRFVRQAAATVFVLPLERHERV